MDYVVYFFCFVYVRNYLLRELLRVAIHILFDVFERHYDGLLNFRQEFLWLINGSYWKLELRCLHHTFVCHHLLSFLFSDDFFRFLFAFSIKS